MSKAASFLKDNVVLEKMDCKLYIAAKTQELSNRPDKIDSCDLKRKIKVYDNGMLLPENAVGADGAVNITYYNPNKYADKCGDHNVDVVYLYDVAFNCSSAGLVIVPEEIRNNESEAGNNATEFEKLNYENPVSPVLENIKENSSVRFRVNLKGINVNEIEIVVKFGEATVSPDEDGFYNIDVVNRDVAVAVYAIPLNGATIDVAEAERSRALKRRMSLQ